MVREDRRILGLRTGSRFNKEQGKLIKWKNNEPECVLAGLTSQVAEKLDSLPFRATRGISLRFKYKKKKKELLRYKANVASFWIACGVRERNSCNVLLFGVFQETRRHWEEQ
jgi:hypothetical protein